MFAIRETENFLNCLEQPEAVAQETLLYKIVRPNCAAAFPSERQFSSITSVQDYQTRVPIVSYEDIRPLIDRMVRGEENVLFSQPVRRFFLTSGSTDKPKYIPVNSSFIGDKSRAFAIYWQLAFAQHPNIDRQKIVTNFSDSGSTSIVAGRLPASSESAYWSQATAATRQRSKPIIPRSFARIADTNARYYAIARVLLEEDIHALMTLNPSTLHLLFHKMNEHRDILLEDIARGTLDARFNVGPEALAHAQAHFRPNPERKQLLEQCLSSELPYLRAHRVWPHLGLVVSWRSPMVMPYVEMLQPHLQGVSSRDYISMASEGILAIPLSDGKSGGVLANSVHFYEFIPESEAESPNPSVRLSHELEQGRSYVVVLSTSAGLYRYKIGDVVRVTGFEKRTPIIEFLHRSGNTSSLTGEKLTEDQVTQALSAVARELNLEIESFTAQPAENGFPRYIFLVELKTAAPAEALSRFPQCIDRALFSSNIEYGSKRDSERLGSPELWIVKAGSYQAQRNKRLAQGTSDSQIKPTHLTRDNRYFAQFEIQERLR